MAEPSADRSQRLFPFLYVDDVSAYLEFLEKAFGFERSFHSADPEDPEHEHAEARLGGAVVMLSHAAPKWGTASPRRLPAFPSAIYAYVEDVDAHCRSARAAGATIQEEPQDKPWGHRTYTARDPEGHVWYFAKPLPEAR